MRHEHVVLTLDPEVREAIAADLVAGESIDDWVRDAIDRKLAGSGGPGYEYVDDCGV